MSRTMGLMTSQQLSYSLGERDPYRTHNNIIYLHVTRSLGADGVRNHIWLWHSYIYTIHYTIIPAHMGLVLIMPPFSINIELVLHGKGRKHLNISNKVQTDFYHEP